MWLRWRIGRFPTWVWLSECTKVVTVGRRSFAVCVATWAVGEVLGSPVLSASDSVLGSIIRSSGVLGAGKLMSSWSSVGSFMGAVPCGVADMVFRVSTG